MNETFTTSCGLFCGAGVEESPKFVKLSLHCLTIEEKEQINNQFQGDTWRLNGQVLWTGIQRNEAQLWADKHRMQTLTTAMGPLMEDKHPHCLRRKKSASAMFAWHITKSQRVTVLSPPPPWTRNPCGLTNYQLIEEPIVKGELGDRPVSCMYMVHPTVMGAEEFSYQIWPFDETHLWVERF